MANRRIYAADLTGKTFVELYVLGKEGVDAKGSAIWRVRCTCGVEKTARHYDLLRGDATSCGCRSRRNAATRLTRHGSATRGEKASGYSPEYRAWMAMRARCNNPKTDFFHRYGGRGIRVDPRWDDFNRFIADMGPKPSAHHTIERRDVNGHYSPENCFWLHRRDQAKNTTRTRLITCRGETRSLAEWAAIAPVSLTTIHARLAKGKSPEDAIFGAPRW